MVRRACDRRVTQGCGIKPTANARTLHLRHTVPAWPTLVGKEVQYGTLSLKMRATAEFCFDDKLRTSAHILRKQGRSLLPVLVSVEHLCTETSQASEGRDPPASAGGLSEACQSQCGASADCLRRMKPATSAWPRHQQCAGRGSRSPVC